MGEAKRRKAQEVDVRDAIEDIEVVVLGPDTTEVLGVNGVVEVIREYPNGTRARMGLAWIIMFLGGSNDH